MASLTAKEIERQFVSSIDPDFFVRMAFLQFAPTQFDADELAALRSRTAATEEQCLKKLVEAADMLIHQLRYFQSEKMLSLLLAGARKGLTLRSVSTFKGDFWKRTLPSLAEGRSPEEFTLSYSGRPLEFDEWVAGCLLGELVDVGHDSWRSVSQHVTNEARFQLDNASFNTFKHVANLTSGEVRLSVQAEAPDEEEDAPYQPIGGSEAAIAWMRWTGRKADFSYEVGAKEVSRSTDVSRIQNSASVVRLWRAARLARLQGGEHAVAVPLLDDPKEPPFKFTMTFGELQPASDAHASNDQS